jgi:F-type H+-transporting ATPase subunit b
MGETIILAQAETASPPTEGEAHEAVPVGGEAGAEAAHAEEGISVEIWLVLALVVLIAIVFRPAKRAILSSLDGRAGRIRGELEEASRLREEAQTALAAIQRKQRDALGEAEEIIAHARQDAERIRAHAMEDLERGLARRQAMALDRIAQAEASALAEVRNAAVDVAVAAARQVIAAEVDAGADARLIDAAIEGLPAKLN